MNILSRFCLFSFLLLATGCSKSTAYWTEQMKSADSVARLHAVHALQERVTERVVVVPVLVGALKDEDTFVRRDAARALGKFGPAAKEAAPFLLDLLHDKEPSVRKAAALALQKIDPKAATKSEEK